MFDNSRNNRNKNENTSPTGTILLVDDKDVSRITTKWFLNHFGYVVDCVRTGEEALFTFDSKSHDLVVTECLTEGMSGVELAYVLKMRSPNTPVVLYSAIAPPSQTCLDLVLIKPTHLLEVKDSLDRILSSSKQMTPTSG